MLPGVASFCLHVCSSSAVECHCSHQGVFTAGAQLVMQTQDLDAACAPPCISQELSRRAWLHPLRLSATSLATTSESD